MAQADLAGNEKSISVETWDNRTEQELNPAQFNTMLRLWRWVLATHPTIPNQMAHYKDLRGLAWHRLGCDGNTFGDFNEADLTTWSRKQTGAKWSSSYNKRCPGNAKINQVPLIVLGGVVGGVVDAAVLARISQTSKNIIAGLIAGAINLQIGKAIGPTGGTSLITVPVVHNKKGKRVWYTGLIDGIWGPMSVAGLQAALAAEKRYTRQIDGQFGPYTIKAWQGWLRDQKTYDGLIDGDFGPLTVKAVQKSMRARGLYGTDYLIDGQFGPYTIMAVQNWLARNY